jgi:hypothetical protein
MSGWICASKAQWLAWGKWPFCPCTTIQAKGKARPW